MLDGGPLFHNAFAWLSASLFVFLLGAVYGHTERTVIGRTLPPAQGIVNMRSGRPSCRLRWGFCSSTCFARMHPGAGGPPWGGKGEANGILQEALHVAAPCPLLGGPGSWLQWLVKPKGWLALPCLSLRWTQSWAPGCTEQYWMSVSVWLVQSFGKATWAGGNDWAHMGYQENTWLTSQL